MLDGGIVATYSCSKCRVNLAAKHGCVICDPVRPFIVFADEGDVSLAEVSKETVKALQDQLRGYRNDLRLNRDPEAKEGINAAVRAVAATLGKVLDASRKIQEDGVKAVELMSAKEKMDLFEAYYLALPPTVRARFMSQLQEAEAAMEQENAGWKDLSVELNGTH